MGKTIRALLTIVACLLITSIAANAEQAEYDNGVICFDYESNRFWVEETEQGTVRVKAIEMPDDGGGHNTVVCCLSTPNTEYSESIELTREEFIEFQKTFAYEMCRGLFEIDNGIAIITDGYSIGKEKSEYFMVLSDATECYVTVYNYGETVYYSVCRLCTYSSELNDEFRSIYRSIEYLPTQDKNSEETVDWGAKYDELSEEYEKLPEEYEEEKEKPEEPQTEIVEEETATESVAGETQKEESNYRELFVECMDVCIQELAVFSDESVLQAIEQGKSANDLKEIILKVLTKSRAGEETLRNYYAEFNEDRTKVPVGTPIMTLLSHAQSALRQYTMALEHLQQHCDDPKQEYLDGFLKYNEKAIESLGEFQALLEEEKEKIK